MHVWGEWMHEDMRPDHARGLVHVTSGLRMERRWADVHHCNASANASADACADACANATNNSASNADPINASATHSISRDSHTIFSQLFRFRRR